jgi:hypothetical protein
MQKQSAKPVLRTKVSTTTKTHYRRVAERQNSLGGSPKLGPACQLEALEGICSTAHFILLAEGHDTGGRRDRNAVFVKTGQSSATLFEKSSPGKKENYK